MTSTLPSALSALALALEKLEAPFLIGGSFAAIAHGARSSAASIDLLVQILPAQAATLCESLGPHWYGDPTAIRNALLQGRCFNLIHTPTGQKFDVFPSICDFHTQELLRAIPVDIESPLASVRCPVATAEDILLAKLQWYRLGGESSQKQWSDVLGIIAANLQLDDAYLSAWSRRLGVEDLLARAREEAAREAG